MCLFKRGKKGITILGINVTISSLQIAVDQSLFRFTQKGSYITNTLVFPNMLISVSIQCEANREGPVIVQELCESRGGRPGLSVLTSLLVSVDIKNY